MDPFGRAMRLLFLLHRGKRLTMKDGRILVMGENCELGFVMVREGETADTATTMSEVEWTFPSFVKWVEKNEIYPYSL